MYDAAKSKANYDYYVRNGRCPKCGGKRKVEPGKHVCRECALKVSESRSSRRAWRRENGLCTRCGNPLPKGATFVQCDSCREYLQSFYRFNRDRYEARREDGRCIKCGKFAEPGRCMCRECHDQWQRTQNKNGEEYRQRKREKRQQMREAGLCIDCGKPVDGEHTRCKRCRDMRMDSTRKYRIHKRTMEAMK